MTPDNTAMRHLAAIQQRRGHVTLKEIEHVFPIDSMTPEEIGRTMNELEEAGIEIEVDKDLLRRRASWGAADVPQASGIKPGVTDAKGPLDGRTNKGAPLLRSNPSAQQKMAGGISWWTPRVGQIAIVVLALVALCLILAFGVVTKQKVS